MKTINFYLFSLLLLPALAHGQDIAGPPGSGAFGTQVLTLANGNFVVTDPTWDNESIADVGAVYLFHGPSRALIKTIVGQSANDRVGSGGVVQLHNGSNFLIMSPEWNNPAGPIAQVGAITWVDGAAGASFAVNATNSLIGLLERERLGTTPVTQLSNGNYIVRHPNWRGTLGAVIWASGSSANPVGQVNATNSLVGRSPLDFVGDTPLVVLTNQHYVITCKDCNSGRGAVAWASGTLANPVGEIGEANALVGKQVGDFVGSGGTWALPNGHYVTSSPNWDNDAVGNVGAVTWGDGLKGTNGPVGVANSIVGSLADDRVGSGGIVPLANSNYVLHSPFWDNPDGTGNDAGAITWAKGGEASAYAVTTTNSLIGNQGERLGQSRVTALPNGHYVAVNETWGGLRGAVTWCNGGQAAPVGKVDANNSLVGLRRTGNGPATTDAVGSNGVTVLANGNYLVNSNLWDEQRGAVTWCSGLAASPVGEVTASNSLTGELPGNLVGLGGVVALDNDKYVVLSPSWEAGPTKLNVGAITLCPASGLTGLVQPDNSLTGSTANDQVGNGGVTKLANGNYVVMSYNWNNTALAVQNAGALTWAAADKPLLGEVGPDNSLVGSQLFTFVRNPKVYALKNGNYVLFSDLSYLAWGNGNQGTFGPLTNDNTLRGLHTHLVELANGNYVIYSRITDRGWVTWCSGTKAIPIGVTGGDISLVDSLFDDRVGHGGVFPLPNGNYVVSSMRWSFSRGANTYGIGSGGTVGFVKARNSILDVRNQVNPGNFAYFSNGDTIVSGKPGLNAIGFFPPQFVVWQGSQWEPYSPLPSEDAVVARTTPSQPGNFSARNLTVNAGANLQIAGGQAVTVNGALHYAGNLTVRSGGSLAQPVGSTLGRASGTFRAERDLGKVGIGFGYSFISSPVLGQSIGTLLANNPYPNNRFRYEPAAAGWLVHTGAMSAGVGYTYLPVGNATSTLAFVGPPNNGPVNLPLSGQPGNRFNLVGNPYPSPIGLAELFAANSHPATGISGTAWFWRDNNNNTGTGSYQVFSGVNVGATQVAVGQGFFVLANSNSGTLAFTNALRHAGNPTFYRGEENLERFRLEVVSPTGRDELWVAFGPQFTSGFEPGYDAEKLEGAATVSLSAVVGGERLAIAALPDVAGGRRFELPLQLFARSGGTHTFSTGEVENPTARKLFLEDRATGEFYYLQPGRSHTLDVPAGTHRGRYFLRAASEVAGQAQAGETAQAYSFGPELFVQAGEAASVAVYDVLGTQVATFAGVQPGALRRLPVRVPAAGVYLVRMAMASGTLEKRVWLDR